MIEEEMIEAGRNARGGLSYNKQLLIKIRMKIRRRL